MHLRKPPARVSLLALACALTILVVAAPAASAATFSGGTTKVDLKTLLSATKAKATFTGADSKTKNAGVFKLGAGTATLVSQSSGNINFASGKAIVLTRTAKVNGKNKTFKVTLGSLVYKLAAGKAQLGAKINNKGKVVYLFALASANKVKPNAAFTALAMSSSKMTVTKAGASALNKALKLVHDTALRSSAASAAGTASFTADRQLTTSGGSTQLIYDDAFAGKLESNDEGCSITLSAIAPGTAIARGPNAPRGGVTLPVRTGDKISAKNYAPLVHYTGGTSLDRGPGNPQGNEYHVTVQNINLDLTISPPGVQGVSSLTGPLTVGTLTGASIAPSLTDTGGSIAVSGTVLFNPNTAAALAATTDPDGAGPKQGCQLPGDAKVGTLNGAIEVT